MKWPTPTLRLLVGGLRSGIVQQADWPAVLEMASRGWLVPELHQAISCNGNWTSVPTPIRDYLSLLHDRNLDRNRRLRGQLVEAVAALNVHGIEPVLLKGGVNLFLGTGNRPGARMMSDLDLGIAGPDWNSAVSALRALGYRFTPNRHLARSCDAGVIDLHGEPSGRSAPFLTRNLHADSARIERDGAVARIPTPTARVIHLIVHDMIKEGDTWRLRVNSRHLQDLAQLAGFDAGVDWLAVSAALPGVAGQAALKLQAAALADLYGISLPPGLRARGWIRLKHLARLAGAERRLGAPIRLYGDLSWGIHLWRTEASLPGRASLIRRCRRIFLKPRGSRL